MEPSQDARIVYADIIDHPHHQSETRAHMPLYDRAAQFSPYDTLAGYYDMIDEEARLTDSAVELDEHALAYLDRELAQLGGAIARGERPRVRFTLFVPDERKAGGSCTSQPTQMSPRLERMIPSPPFITGKLERMSTASMPYSSLK